LPIFDSVFRDQDRESYDADMQATCGEKYAKAKNKKAFFHHMTNAGGTA
jgi:hypothetical protein